MILFNRYREYFYKKGKEQKEIDLAESPI